jgi:predicted XRE-type DNA-binding protein
MPRKASAVTHVTRGDVFDDLGFTRSESTALKIKADLLDAVRKEIERKRYSQRELIAILDEYQPAVSNLMRGPLKVLPTRKVATAA